MSEEIEKNEEEEIWKVWRDTRLGKRGALWELSTFGNIRKSGKEYIPKLGNNGYLMFAHHYLVHRAVAELFIPNPENKPTVDHIDRNPQNNHYSNLRWATYSEQLENRDIETFKKHIRESLKGRKFSEERRKKISEALKGKKKGPLSEEIKKKLSESLKGERNPRYGTHLSEETRKKISLAHKGKHAALETRQKMSKTRKGRPSTFKGKHHSQETLRKMSEKAKQAWARRKSNC